MRSVMAPPYAASWQARAWPPRCPDAPTSELTDDDLNEDERRVVEAVDADALVADLADLVAFAPVGGSAGEVGGRSAGALTAFAASGSTSPSWDIDLSAEAAQPDFPGMEVEREALVGVVATWAADGSETPDATPALVLCGHTDVVPVEDSDPVGERPVPSGRRRRRASAVVGPATCSAGVAPAMLAAVPRAP